MEFSTSLTLYYFLIGILITAIGYLLFRANTHPLVRLKQAILKQDLQELKLVLSKVSKDDIDFPVKTGWLTTLGTAIQVGNIEIVELLIKAGATVNFGFNLENRHNPLLVAAIEKRYDIIEILI